MSQTKKPKETDEVKKKLEHYATYQRRIDNLIERLEYLESTMGSASTPPLRTSPACQAEAATAPARPSGKSSKSWISNSRSGT